jgi:hypothetical protein
MNTKINICSRLTDLLQAMSFRNFLINLRFLFHCNGLLRLAIVNMTNRSKSFS